MVTARDVETEILERASLTPKAVADLPMVSKFFDGGSRTWEVGKPHPGNPSLVIHSMFLASIEDGYIPGDVRVYAFPTSVDVPFARFIVNRQFPGFSSESMNDEVYFDELAAEFRELALSKGVLEECPNKDCDAVVLADAEVCGECGEKLTEDEGTSETIPAPPDGGGTPAATM